MARNWQNLVLATVLIAPCMCTTAPGCISDTPPDGTDVAEPSIVATPLPQGSAVLATFSGADVRSIAAVTNHGAGTTKFAVIMAGGYAATRVSSDLGAFRTANSLNAGGTLQVVNKDGNTSPLPSTISTAWEQAAAAGLQIAAALGDSTTPILVEADSASWSDLDVAIKRAKTMGATRIILPFTLASDPGDGTTFAAGALYIAGTGLGASLTFPALSAKVIAVSPTKVQTDMSSRGFSEVVSSSPAVGCSSRAKPAYQADSICATSRTVPDMAALGDVDTVVTVYHTPNGGSQGTFGASGVGVSAAFAGGWLTLDPSGTVSNLYANFGTATYDLDTAGFDANAGGGSPHGNPSF